MITLDDIKLMFPTLIEVIILAFVFNRLLVFISSFILSLVGSIRNKSIIYDSDHLVNPSLNTKLDSKTMLDKEVVSSE